MTLAERVRHSLPQQPNLRKVSLRTKLVASVLVLVFAALTLISAASTYALHSYLLQRLDEQLAIYSATITSNRYSRIPVPGDYYVSITSMGGAVGTTGVGDTSLSASDLPPTVTGVENVMGL